jgi:O-antigen/teichoic acid export membrane protein
MDEGDAAPDFETLRRWTFLGVAALGAKGAAGKLISLASMLFLARLLSPADFGAFALVQLPVTWLNLLADAGVSAALIQGEYLSPRQEQAGFTLRLILAACTGLLLVLLANTFGAFYELSAQAVAALRLLALGPMISALGTIPGVHLTRGLRFDRLALVEAGSLLCGQLTAVVLASGGVGLWSLVYGSLLTITAGTVLVNLLSPWPPRLLLAPGTMRSLLRFGLTFQGQGLVHLAKDQLVPALGGRFYGNVQLGYVTWAMEVARWPRLPADTVARVSFPAFSRLQRDPQKLARLARDTAGSASLITFIAAGLGIALAPAVVPLLFGKPWVPAVPILQLLLLQTPMDALAAVLLPLIYATGRVGQGLRLSLAWAGLAWVTSALLLSFRPMLTTLPLAILFSTTAALLLIGRRLPPGVVLDWGRILLRPAAVALLIGGLVYMLAGR